MRLDVHVIDVQPTAALKEYTQSRLWLGLQEHARRILCAGVWLTERAGGPEEGARFVCRTDVWLRRIGPVTVRHVESNPFVAVDLAVARMRHRVSRCVQRAPRAAASTGAADELSNGNGRARVERSRRRGPASPRLAVVVERRGPSSASSAAAWLRDNFDVDQVSRLTVSDPAWESAADADHELLERSRSCDVSGQAASRCFTSTSLTRSGDRIHSAIEPTRLRLGIRGNPSLVFR